MQRCLLVAVALLASSASADSWAPFQPFAAVSADGQRYAIVRADEVELALRVGGPAVQPGRGTRRVAPADRTTARLPLSPPPMDAAIFDDGRFVAFDTYASLGRGEVLRAFDDDGNSLWSLDLDGLFAPGPRPTFTRSVSSIHWSAGWWIDDEAGLVGVAWREGGAPDDRAALSGGAIAVPMDTGLPRTATRAEVQRWVMGSDEPGHLAVLEGTGAGREELRSVAKNARSVAVRIAAERRSVELGGKALGVAAEALEQAIAEGLPPHRGGRRANRAEELCLRALGQAVAEAAQDGPGSLPLLRQLLPTALRPAALAGLRSVAATGARAMRPLLDDPDRDVRLAVLGGLGEQTPRSWLQPLLARAAAVDLAVPPPSPRTTIPGALPERWQPTPEAAEAVAVLELLHRIGGADALLRAAGSPNPDAAAWLCTRQADLDCVIAAVRRGAKVAYLAAALEQVHTPPDSLLRDTEAGRLPLAATASFLAPTHPEAVCPALPELLAGPEPEGLAPFLGGALRSCEGSVDLAAQLARGTWLASVAYALPQRTAQELTEAVDRALLAAQPDAPGLAHLLAKATRTGTRELPEAVAERVVQWLEEDPPPSLANAGAMALAMQLDAERSQRLLVVLPQLDDHPCGRLISMMSRHIDTTQSRLGLLDTQPRCAADGLQRPVPDALARALLERATAALPAVQAAGGQLVRDNADEHALVEAAALHASAHPEARGFADAVLRLDSNLAGMAAVALGETREGRAHLLQLHAEGVPRTDELARVLERAWHRADEEERALIEAAIGPVRRPRGRR